MNLKGMLALVRTRLLELALVDSGGPEGTQ